MRPKALHVLLAAVTILATPAALAQTASPAAAPNQTSPPAAGGAKMDKAAVSKACSQQADAQHLHGKARKDFRSKCKQHGGTT